MSTKGIVCAVALSLSTLMQPALADKYAANCRFDYDYDEPDKVESGFMPGQILTTPGKHNHVHYRMRLDIDTDAGTVRWSGDPSGDTVTWHNGDMWRSSGKDVKVFVKANGRLIRFGTDTFNSDRSVDSTVEHSFDLSSGLLTDKDGRRWECEKADENRFRQ